MDHGKVTKMTGRRPYGEGAIYKQGDKWIGRLDVGYTETGGRRRVTVSGATKTDVRSKLKQLRRDRDNGATGLSASTTVKAWADEWLPRQAERVRPQSFNADRSAVRQWIVPTIGRRRLAELTAADIRKVHTAVIAKRKRSSALRVHATLMTALKAALAEGHAVPARVLQVPPPAQERSDRRDISVPEAILLLKAAAEDPMRSRWVAALLQGMRQAECLGLTWECVDLEAQTIDVSWQLQALPYDHGCGGTCGKRRGCDCPERHFRVPVGYEHEQLDGALHLVRPKTAAGQRIIPLVPWMTAALTQWREIAPQSPLVWPRSDGRPQTAPADLTAWHDLQKAADVTHPSGRRYHLHEARHSTATILLALGIPAQVIEAIMGHSSILSSNRYMHADLDMARKALNGVAAQLQLSA